MKSFKIRPLALAILTAAVLPWCMPGKALEAGPVRCVGCLMTMTEVTSPPAGTMTVQMIPMPGNGGDVNGECEVNSANTCVADKPCNISFMLSVTIGNPMGPIHTRFEDEFGTDLGAGPILTGIGSESEVVEWQTPVSSDCEGAGGASANVIFFVPDSKGNETLIAHYKVYCSHCDTIQGS